MPNRYRLRSMLPVAAIGLAALLGGCVAYPAYPTYGYNAPYYGGGYPYYGGPYVGVGVGGGWREGGWHDRGWHDGWRR
jgi:hypothetical protein